MKPTFLVLEKDEDLRASLEDLRYFKIMKSDEKKLLTKPHQCALCWFKEFKEAELE